MNFIGSRPQLWFDQKDNAYLVFLGDRFHPLPGVCIAAASAKSRWTDWKIIHREEGLFSGQPQLDRYGKPGVLSVYIQEEPKTARGTASPLGVIEFRPVN